MPTRSEARRDDEAEMPATIRRSPAKAQRTWKETHDAAAREYGEGEHAHRVAYVALTSATRRPWRAAPTSTRA